MKIAYISNSRIPTERAHGIQIIKMCEAFAELGHDVTLFVPRRMNKIKLDAYTYYNVGQKFKIKYLPTIDTVRFGKVGFIFQSIVFSLVTLFRVSFSKYDAVYSRDEIVLYPMSFFGKNIVLELHDNKSNFAISRLLVSAKIVAITNSIKDFCIQKGADKDAVIVAHDAVDLNMFDIKESKMECRNKLELPHNKKIVLYSGHLYEWKGVQVLAEASRLFDSNMLVVFVGGTDSDVELFKRKNVNAANILIVGHRSYQEIPIWIKSADAVVLPNIDNRPTSPMKLFEYMASGVPIVASNLNSIREILNDDNSILFRTADKVELAKSINECLNNSILSKSISDRAFGDSRGLSWLARARKIIDFISNHYEK